MSDLFDVAAELEAIATGRPLSQTLAELKGAPRAPLLSADGLRFSVDANGKRERHSHRCKCCRYSCLLLQRQMRLAATRRALPVRLVTLRDLSPSSRGEAVRFAAEVVRKTEHRGTAYIVDDDGFCHVKGEYGNAERSAFEYTKAEVIALRGILRERGAKTAFDVAERLLAEALAVADGWYTVTVSTSAERMARKRAKAPPELCVVCSKRKARKGLKTCEECNAAAIERVQASRQKLSNGKSTAKRRK